MSPASSAPIGLELEVVRPYSARPLLAYLGARAMLGVEQVGGDFYRRVVAVSGEPRLLELGFSRADTDGVISVSCAPGHGLTVESVRELADALTDARAPVGAIERQLASDRQLAPLVRKHPGARIPGTVDPFELAVRAILGQQISVAAACTLAGRIAARWGQELALSEDLPRFAFPDPEGLVDAPLESAGLSRARAGAIRELAAAVAAERIVLQPGRDFGQVEESLLSIKGIGPWTASYIALRGLRNRDAIPVGDLGLRQALGSRGGALSAGDVAERAERWRPWRGYGAVHLWSTFLAIQP